VDIHAHSWYARASLPCNRFLFHINCNTIVSNKCSSLTFNFKASFFYGKAYFLDFSTSITSLQTNPAIFRLLGSCSPGYIIILFSTRIRVLRKHKTQQYESDPGILLSHHIYWSTPRSPRSRLLVIRYLPNLLNMTLVARSSSYWSTCWENHPHWDGVSYGPPVLVLFAKWNFLFEYSI
jgi:hypothetical protein